MTHILYWIVLVFQVILCVLYVDLEVRSDTATLNSDAYIQLHHNWSPVVICGNVTAGIALLVLSMDFPPSNFPAKLVTYLAMILSAIFTVIALILNLSYHNRFPTTPLFLVIFIEMIGSGIFAIYHSRRSTEITPILG
jgi:hypothetical protein